MAKKKRNKKKNNNNKYEIISTRIKGLIEKIKPYIIDFWENVFRPYLMYMILPFAMMDIFIFIFGSNISYSSHNYITPVLFTIKWLVLFLGLTLSFKEKIGKVIYLFFNILFLILFLVNNVYYSMTKTFFDFNLMESASEGGPYILDTLKNCNPLVYVAFFIVIVFIIIGYKKIPTIKENNYKTLKIILIIFLVLHLLVPFTLGKANKKLTWSSWRNPRNIYNSFNDSNKSMKISGFYEYSFRNFYITFLKTKEQINEEEMSFLDDAYSIQDDNKNKYTGLLKGKNLIIIQLEGTDNWLLTKEDTPNMYKMMSEGINFNNHFSYYNGGGSTFNSEFAVNTGFITPLSYTKNAYSFNKNSFPNSLAKLFKKNNYTVNAFHMNTGEYYSRTVNYKNWGYDNYYGLIDMDKYNDDSYQLDRELVLNEKFNELMFADGNFLDYIIAYSGHLPFTNTKGVCKMLYEEDNQKKFEETGEVTEFVQMTEEECARRQNKETDYMVQLLVEELTKRDILKDTVFVIFTDHYLYTLEDKTILDKYKDSSNNLINKTPFFIWTPGIKKEKVNKVTSQLNVLPTILNLYGIEYNTSDYISTDALDSDYKGMVFFSDYSWYDGNVYVENGEVTNGKSINLDSLEEKNQYISYITKKNDLTLKYNYFKKKGSE